MSELICRCRENGEVRVADPDITADLIFILVDGAYYYLSLITDKKEYSAKLKRYKQRAIDLLDVVG